MIYNKLYTTQLNNLHHYVSILSYLIFHRINNRIYECKNNKYVTMSITLIY